MNAAIKSTIMREQQPLLSKQLPTNKVSSLTLPVAMGYGAFVDDITIKNTQVFYTLNHRSQVQTAVTAESLLLMPEVGDQVLCIDIDDEIFITQILKRAQISDTLQIHSHRPVEWVAPVLRFKALQEMELLSVNKLTLSARDVISSASRTLVQQAQNLLQQAKTYSLTTKGLMRLTGRQQVIVAEEDIRMDAKRINMG